MRQDTRIPRRIGRPPSLSPEQIACVRTLVVQGHSVGSIARTLNTTRQTIIRTKKQYSNRPTSR
ncbi:helix-turn-helix domain-containing protein [Ensifer sp. NM-2]|uniref:helix-turn-helix domain-containing protein n=1 Tax=Ensifer sp. NM-2 TaxID=2109730 RepID=UPI00352BA701